MGGDGAAGKKGAKGAPGECNCLLKACQHLRFLGVIGPPGQPVSWDTTFMSSALLSFEGVPGREGPKGEAGQLSEVVSVLEFPCASTCWCLQVEIVGKGGPRGAKGVKGARGKKGGRCGALIYKVCSRLLWLFFSGLAGLDGEAGAAVSKAICIRRKSAACLGRSRCKGAERRARRRF